MTDAIKTVATVVLAVLAIRAIGTTYLTPTKYREKAAVNAKTKVIFKMERKCEYSKMIMGSTT